MPESPVCSLPGRAAPTLLSEIITKLILEKANLQTLFLLLSSPTVKHKLAHCTVPRSPWAWRPTQHNAGREG